VAEERALNPRLSKPMKEFVDIMNNLNLPYPTMIGKSGATGDFLESFRENLKARRERERERDAKRELSGKL